MKSRKINILTIIFSLISMLSYGQAVDAVVLVGGVPNNVTKTKTICLLQDSVRLEASNCGTCTAGSNVTIKWQQAFSPFTTTNSAFVYAKQGGWWRVTVTNNSNTTQVDKDSVYIDFYAYPSFVANVNGAKCAFDDKPPYGLDYDTATISFTGYGSLSSYQWGYLTTANQLIILPGHNLDTFVYSKGDIYVVGYARDGHGCLVGDTEYVFQKSALSVGLGPDPTTASCEGNSYSLHTDSVPGLAAIGTVTCSFYDGSTLIHSTSGLATNSVPPPYNIPSLSPGNRVFSVILINDNGPYCPNHDTLNLTVNPLPTFTFPNPSSYCEGSILQLTPTITDGEPISSWSWTSLPASPSGLSATNIPNPTVSGITSNRIYYPTATNACGPRTFPFTVNYSPPITLKASATGYLSSSVSDTTICYLIGVANLKSLAINGAGGFTYKWTPGLGLVDSSLANTTTNSSLATTTDYTITAYDANNCTAVKTLKVTLYKPTINLTTSSVDVPPRVNEDTPLTIDAGAHSGYTYLWTKETYTGTPPDPNSIEVDNTTHSLFIPYKGDDTASFYVKVTDPANGCINMDTVQVYFITKNVVLYVPNVFSPNAELPDNQTLKVFGDNLSSENFKMIVYNKWGKQVWEADLEAAKAGWDGSSYEQGVYTYYISGKFKNDLPVTASPHYKGNFTLLK